MKIILHIDDDSSAYDMIFIGRAIGHLLNNPPDNIGGFIYPKAGYEISWIKNKSSYSVWGRKSVGKT